MFYPNKSLDKSPPGAISRGRRHQRGLLRGDFAQRHRTTRPLGAGRRVASRRWEVATEWAWKIIGKSWKNFEW